MIPTQQAPGAASAACRELAAGVVDGIVAGEKNLGDGDKGIAVLKQRFNDGGQGLRGVLGGVVEQHDGARLHLGDHPLCDLVGGQVFPVQAVYVPLNGLHADGADGIDGVVVVVAVGRADQGGAHAGDRLHLVVTGVQVGYNLVGGQLGIVIMGVGVVHDLMSRLMERQHGFRVLLRPLAHHKERGLDVVLPQNINELLGVLVAPW